MSRAGTPTDNPIIESLNGWMKAELILDFGISKVSNLKKTLDQYVLYFNSERFAAALDYKTPIQYRTELGLMLWLFIRVYFYLTDAIQSLTNTLFEFYFINLEARLFNV